MHVLESPPGAPPLTVLEQFFLETWYGMTHQRSFDSYRVRCFNVRTILRELHAELVTNLLADSERKELCAEALALLQADPLFAATYPYHWAALQPALASPPPLPKNKTDPFPGPEERRFRFAIADTVAALELSYFEELLHRLRAAMNGGQEGELREVTGALLSDLVDQGWPLESLHSWVHRLLKPFKSWQNFQDGVAFMLAQLERPPQLFTAALKLSGSPRLLDLGSLAGFQLLPAPSLPLPASIAKAHASFFAPSDNSCFAQTTLRAVDFRSAGIFAVEAFEQCLDRLRFNFAPARLDIQARVLCRREGDGQISVPEIRTLVPNPAFHLSADQFRAFGEEIDGVLARHDLMPDSRERIQAALRHYRFGRDAESYKDMCLNWWMGLEFLAKIGDGHIGETVVRHTSDMLVRRYLLQSLEDALQTLQHTAVLWTSDLAAVSGAATLEALSAKSLLPVLQSEPCTEQLCQALAPHPAVVFLLRRLALTLRTPAATAAALEQHHQRLRWQLARLYRVRCCIVHGSPLLFRLGLLSANLEVYLREMIVLCIRSLALHPHLQSLQEIFQRAHFSCAHLITELKAGQATAIPRAAFNSFVLG